MLTTILFVILAAVLVTAVAVALRRPREGLIRASPMLWFAVSPRRHEDMQRGD